MKRYFIISLSRSQKDSLVFWRAEDSGYTCIPFLAGIYTEQQILAQLDYYTENSVPVPVEDWEEVFKISFNANKLLAFRKEWKANIKMPKS